MWKKIDVVKNMLMIFKVKDNFAFLLLIFYSFFRFLCEF